MNAEQKVRMARVLGVICLVVGAMNLVIVLVQGGGEQSQTGSPLFITGLAALSGGALMLAVSKRRPPSGE
jgi:hypothetical protein